MFKRKDIMLLAKGPYFSTIYSFLDNLGVKLFFKEKLFYTTYLKIQV